MNINEEHELFFYELGLSFSQWSGIEHNVLEVLSSCVSPTDDEMFARGFYAIENFRSKVAFSSAVIQAKFREGPLVDAWAGIAERLSGAAALRNRLAHETMVCHVEGELGRRFALQPWPAKPDAQTTTKARPPPGALCVRDIVGIRFQFFALFVTLQNFRRRIGNLEPLEGFSEQPMALPTIRTLRNLMRSRLALPPLPSRK
jgi:hypothetical protein